MKKYGLLGYPLKHTMSPPIHKRLFELEGVSDFSYELMEIPEETLKTEVDRCLNLDGFNITIPHKVNIIGYIDELADSANRYNSVNCVKNDNGKHIGYNTDCDGFLRSIRAAGGNISGNVLQCGCGGVGRMIAIECIREGARLTVSVPEGFENTVDPVKKYAADNVFSPDIKVVHPEETASLGSFDTLINASPVGMFPKVDACPVSEETIKKCGFVFDVIYNRAFPTAAAWQCWYGRRWWLMRYGAAQNMTTLISKSLLPICTGLWRNRREQTFFQRLCPCRPPAGNACDQQV